MPLEGTARDPKVISNRVRARWSVFDKISKDIVCGFPTNEREHAPFPIIVRWREVMGAAVHRLPNENVVGEQAAKMILDLARANLRCHDYPHRIPCRSYGH